MKTIIVTGSVGTGKTTVAKAVAEHFDYEYIDVTKLIKENALSDGYDKEKECEIVDENKLSNFLVKLIDNSNAKGLVIDSHMSHYLPKEKVNLCIVTKCDLKILRKRLADRVYNEDKIKDNLESEIFNVCFEEAKEKGHKIILIETSHGISKDLFDLL